MLRSESGTEERRLSRSPAWLKLNELRTPVDGLGSPPARRPLTVSTHRCRRGWPHIQAAIPASHALIGLRLRLQYAHGTAATTMTSTSIPGRQKSVVRQARAGGYAGSTQSFQTELCSSNR